MTMAGRDFDPAGAGGPIRRLTTRRIKVTDRGVTAVIAHLARFGPDEANQVMVDRLWQIACGAVKSTPYDLNFFSHELREFVRYRRLGYSTGGGDNYDLWNNAHTATLEDYGLSELDANKNRNLFHPTAWPLVLRLAGPTGQRRLKMPLPNAKLTFLRLIEDHPGEWGWYQFERAFPPGWFDDEPPTVRAKDILDRLQSEGLVTIATGDAMGKYRLTPQGTETLREATVGFAAT